MNVFLVLLSLLTSFPCQSWAAAQASEGGEERMQTLVGVYRIMSKPRHECGAEWQFLNDLISISIAYLPGESLQNSYVYSLSFIMPNYRIENFALGQFRNEFLDYDDETGHAWSTVVIKGPVTVSTYDLELRTKGNDNAPGYPTPNSTKNISREISFTNKVDGTILMNFRSVESSTYGSQAKSSRCQFQVDLKIK